MRPWQRKINDPGQERLVLLVTVTADILIYLNKKWKLNLRADNKITFALLSERHKLDNSKVSPCKHDLSEINEHLTGEIV